MQPLRYSINVTLDGCVDHRAGIVNRDIHRVAEEFLAGADAMVFGRVTYGLMEDGWREVARTGVRPDWMEDWMMPFARVIDAGRKYVVSDTLQSVDWNAELVRSADLERKVRELKAQPGRGLALGGVAMPLALAKLGLIDEYQFVVTPRLAGHGPYLFQGLAAYVDLKALDRHEFASGVVVTRYVPRAGDAG